MDAYEALPKGSDERGAYLRREGLYSSHLSEWRQQRDRGVLAGLAPKARQAKRTAEQVELDRARPGAPREALEDALINLSSVATDLLGVLARAMIEALIAGEREPQALADLARGKLNT